MQTVLLILNQAPYESGDLIWNALRLANKLLEAGAKVRIFLVNDAVDLARDSYKKPESYDQDLVAMLKDLIKKDVPVEVCTTCMSRCGIYKNEAYYEGAKMSSHKRLAEWILDSDKVLTY